MDYNDTHSRYCYPGTNVLINKLDIRDQETLTNVERTLTAQRQVELMLDPLKGSFDLKHLQDIHRHLFQDVYEFAGKIRTEDIAKDNFMFAPSRFIEPAAQDLFKNMQRENFTGVPAEKVAERAAYHMAEINVLHPFREGNGRSQRELTRTFLISKGYEIDWSRVDTNRLLEASIRSVSNHKELGKVIDDCLVNRQPEKALIREFNDRGLER
ncbi:Fic family protein [Priestia megaterium]|uniref:Fic/DOC family protein n=1 Tax=Priestia megaterium TaxID=1404 RepID=UPI0034574EE1